MCICVYLCECVCGCASVYALLYIYMYHTRSTLTYIYMYILETLRRWASEREVYISGSTLLCQFIDPVMFARCAFIFALRNIALGGYLDTRRNI